MDKKDINIEYGRILRDYRRKNNLTQEKVAELSGLAPRYISQIERGELKGSINTLLAFCNVYHITPNDILGVFLCDYPLFHQDSYDDKINRLSLRDKELIDELLNFLTTH